MSTNQSSIAEPYPPPLRKLVQRRRDVVAQAQKNRFKLKALLSFSQSNFETGCFQARVELAPPYREMICDDERRPHAVVLPSLVVRGAVADHPPAVLPHECPANRELADRALPVGHAREDGEDEVPPCSGATSENKGVQVESTVVSFSQSNFETGCAFKLGSSLHLHPHRWRLHATAERARRWPR